MIIFIALQAEVTEDINRSIETGGFDWHFELKNIYKKLAEEVTEEDSEGGVSIYGENQ